MRIAFFAPHKPVDHPVPSGDLMIARGLRDFLIDSGHRVEIASRERLWKIIESPGRWPSVFFEYGRILERMEKFRPDLWITYHSYHKSPDLYGPEISQRLGIPYVIYQGVFATKYRRNFRTWPGYMANKKALLYSAHVFANKEIDFCNLSRIIIPEKLSRTYPGINTDDFSFCPHSRKDVRSQLGLGKTTTLISVAMLREDVKAESITDLIQAFGTAAGDTPDMRLLIAGEGEARARLEKLAEKVAGEKIVFLGSIPRKELFRYYSAADVFAFPGINEALGMVYLEAQCAGLPVVAYSTRGPSEAVAHMETGLLSPQGDIQALAENITEIVRNTELRERMKKAAPKRIKRIFDLRSNLAQVEKQLLKLI
ncbi:glycosyltransferase family 4 protein [Maridesulfovibrio sp.]|uniref:glycosyltransferase family 4 protein n=1 Tax=Maridesulfovibrio sp. TaxID=2795000 RepID=UPI002A18951F|nr:glycosyltransferase family 4 protein [Maridesulfovibrio sp.]